MDATTRRAVLADVTRDAAEREPHAPPAAIIAPRAERTTPYTADDVLRKLGRSDVFVERCLLHLYDLQTREEQTSHATRETNGVGFNRVDAAFLTSLARQVQSGPSRGYGEGSRLSPRQRAAARASLRKYVGQLLAHANRRFRAS